MNTFNEIVNGWHFGVVPSKDEQKDVEATEAIFVYFHYDVAEHQKKTHGGDKTSTYKTNLTIPIATPGTPEAADWGQVAVWNGSGKIVNVLETLEAPKTEATGEETQTKVETKPEGQEGETSKTE